MSRIEIERQRSAFGCYVQKKKRTGLKIMPYSRRWFFLDLAEKVLGYAHDSTGRKNQQKPLDVPVFHPDDSVCRIRERPQVQKEDQDFISLRKKRCAYLGNRGSPAGFRRIRSFEDGPRDPRIFPKCSNHSSAVSIRKRTSSLHQYPNLPAELRPRTDLQGGGSICASVPQPQTGELRRTITAFKNAFRNNSPQDNEALVIESPKQTKLISLKKGFFSTNHKIFNIKPKHPDEDCRPQEIADQRFARDFGCSELADHDDSTAPEKKSNNKLEINFANILEEALRMNGVSNWQRTESARRRERERQKLQEDLEKQRLFSPTKQEVDQEESYLSSNCSPRKSLKHSKPLRLITTAKKNTVGFFARKNDASSSPAKRDSDSDSFDGNDKSKLQTSPKAKNPKPNSSFTNFKGRLKTINFSQKKILKDNLHECPFQIHIASKSKTSLAKDSDQNEEVSSPKSKISFQKNISLSLQKKGEPSTISRKLLTLSKKGKLIQQNPTIN